MADPEETAESEFALSYEARCGHADPPLLRQFLWVLPALVVWADMRRELRGPGRKLEAKHAGRKEPTKARAMAAPPFQRFPASSPNTAPGETGHPHLIKLTEHQKPTSTQPAARRGQPGTTLTHLRAPWPANHTTYAGITRSKLNLTLTPRRFPGAIFHHTAREAPAVKQRPLNYSQ